VQYVSATKYFLLKLTPHARQIYARHLEEAQVLEFDKAKGRTCLDSAIGTVGLYKGVIDDTVCQAVLKLVTTHADSFCNWAHDGRFNDYMKKLAIEAEGMKPFPHMRGRAETDLDEQSLAQRRSKVLHTKDHPYLVKLVDSLYTIASNLRPDHLKDAPGADTRYPVTIGVCGTHIMPHSDEPGYDGPGAWIFNFIVLGQGLVALSSSFHNKEAWRVFEVNTGDVWWIADQFRFEWEHEVLRDMPTPVPVDFLDLSKQRIVVTVRMGETSPAQEARWEHIYSSSYVDVESTDKGKPSGGTAMLPANGGRLTRKWLSDHKRGDGDIGEDHVHTPRTTGPAAPRESATYATTATGRHPQGKWQLGNTLRQFRGHAAFHPFDSLSPTRSDITFTPGVQVVQQSSTIGTVLAVGTITDKGQERHYVCIVHIPNDDEVHPVLAVWLLGLDKTYRAAATNGKLPKTMTNKLNAWLKTQDATARLQNRPLRSVKNKLEVSLQEVEVDETTEPQAKKPRLSRHDSADKNQLVVAGPLRELQQLMTSSNPSGDMRSSSPGGANYFDNMGTSFGALSSGLAIVGSHLREITGGISADEARQRERENQERLAAVQKEKNDNLFTLHAAHAAKLAAAVQKEKDELAKVTEQNTHFLQQFILANALRTSSGTPTTPTPTPPTRMTELQGLKQMLDDGLIDAEEWKEMKKEVFSRYN